MAFLNSLLSGSSPSSASVGPSAAGSLFSSSGSSSSRQGVQYNPGSQDNKFCDIIKDTPYNYLTEVPVKYNVSINRKIFGHWFLVLEMELEGSTLPNLSLEISTPDLKSIKREIYTNSEKSTYCGPIVGYTLTSILNVADSIVANMGFYSLFTSNCQHFCNNFLNHYGFGVYNTTLGKDVTAEIEKQIDKTPEQYAVLGEIQQLTMIGNISDAPLQQPIQYETERKMRLYFALLLNAFVRAN